MNTIRKILCLALCTSCLSPMAVIGANADEELIYGTMNIPYNEFFANETVCHEVDAVSSATTGKWKNENLVAGSYAQENSDGSGTILGVSYPVALTKETLDTLSEKYSFTPSDTTPSAYKLVTLKDGKADFSAVIGNTTDIVGVNTSLNSNSVWGDYQITVDAIHNSNGTSDIGRIFGVILTTEKGEKYALRHLQNIWRDELAWSSGIKTSEPHGNVLNYEDYVGLMGQTIDNITYITDSGYHILDTDLYVPVKFENTVTVENAGITDGKTTFTATTFPEGYLKSYSIENLSATVSDGTITYSNALPNQYTLKISDANGIYADVFADFILSTDSLPVKFDGKKITVADTFSNSDFENYMNNLSSVTIGENTYGASGKHGVKIIDTDGTIDLTAMTKGEVPVFDGSGIYEMTVSATGYTNDLKFTLNTTKSDEPATEPTTETATTKELPTTPTTAKTEPTTSNTNNNNTNTNTTNTTTSNTQSSGKTVNTGQTAQTVSMLTVLLSVGAVMTAFFRKKHNK